MSESAVPDPLKGTKGTGLRPRASGGLAPQGALQGPSWPPLTFYGFERREKEKRRRKEKN